MHSESRKSGNSPLTTPIGTRITNISRRLSSSNQLPGLLASSGSKDYRLNSSHADYNTTDSDYAKITMKTRVTVRDKTPHRFQVVPLRDVSKLALESGRPSQLALPLASHTLLRSASIRRQNHSQTRPVIAASYSQMDLNTQDNCNVTMLVDSETLATPCTEKLTIALSPFELDGLGELHALAEQDMNRQFTKSTTHKLESSITTPTSEPQGYNASYHNHPQNPSTSFSNRSSSLHIKSQSLDLASCSGTHSRSTPEQLFANNQTSIIGSKSPRKKRTRSENIPSIRDTNKSDGTKECYDSRMTKRHAIYTQSLHVPFLSSSYFSGSSTKNRNGHHQLFGAHPKENISDGYKTHHPEKVSFSQMSQAFVSGSGAMLPNTNFDDNSSPSTSATVPHTGPLNYHRLSRVYPLSGEARLHGKIVYPQIVREMFTDIERAIHEWRHI